MKTEWKDMLSNLKSELPEENGTRIETVIEQEKKQIQKEPLRIELDKRNGKPATLISCFEGSDEELKNLAKILKIKCGAGGSQRNGEILIQGDFRVKICEILVNSGFKIKKINFK